VFSDTNFPPSAAHAAESLAATLGSRFLERLLCHWSDLWSEIWSALERLASCESRQNHGTCFSPLFTPSFTSFASIRRACFNGSPGLPRGRSFHRPRTFNSSLSTWKNLLRGVMARISWRILASSKSSQVGATNFRPADGGEKGAHTWVDEAEDRRKYALPPTPVRTMDCREQSLSLAAPARGATWPGRN
jgi:hypothetical protein